MMKKIALACFVLLIAGMGFADPLEMIQQKANIDSLNPARTDNYIDRNSDDLRLTDPNAGKVKLSELSAATEAQIVTVAKSGADYTTVQGAIDSISDASIGKPYVVLIFPGVYSETVTLYAKSYVDLVGVSRNACIITRNYSPPVVASFGDGTLNWGNSNGRIQNLTVRNTASSPNASIALYLGTGTKDIFNCTFYGDGRDIVTCGGGDNSFKDCKIYSENAAHSVWIYNGDNRFIDCLVEASGVPCQFTTAPYVKSATFYWCWINNTFGQTAFDCDDGNNTLTVDDLFCGGNITTLVESTNATFHIGRVVGATINVAHTALHSYVTDLTVKDGLNIGTATGAGAGTAKLLDGTGTIIIADDSLSADQDWSISAGNAAIKLYSAGEINLYGGGLNVGPTARSVSEGDAYIEGGLNVGTVSGAGAGEIKVSEKITAKLFDVQHHAGGLPPPTSLHRGCLAFVEGGTGSEDKLYVCVKNADGSYAWDEIGQGTSQSRVTFE